MPGIASGIAEGLRTAQEIGMQQQRLDLEKQREDFEQGRQRASDALSATNQQIQDLEHSEAPALAVLKGAPPDPGSVPPADPKLRAEYDKAKAARDAYTAHDDYKAAIDTLNGNQATRQKLTDARDRQLRKLGGFALNGLSDRAAQTQLRMATGGVDSVSGRDMLDAALSDTKMPPTFWLKDPKTGMSTADQVQNQLAEGIRTGQWDGKEGSITALMPFLHLAIGHKLPGGGTITGAQVSHIFHDPKDPNILHISQTIHHENDDGTTGASQTPHMDENGVTVNVTQLMDAAKQLGKWNTVFQDPRAQTKAVQAYRDGDTVVHDVMRSYAQAGIPEEQQLPGYTVKPVAGGAFLERAGQKPEFVQTQQKITTATQRQHYIDIIQDPASTKEEVQAALEAMTAQGLAEKTPTYRGAVVTPESTRAPPGNGGSKGAPKYSEDDKKAFEDTLRQRVAESAGAELYGLDKKDDPLDYIKDKGKAADARRQFNNARIKLRQDIKAGKEVDIDSYVPAAAPKPAAKKPSGKDYSSLF